MHAYYFFPCFGREQGENFQVKVHQKVDVIVKEEKKKLYCNFVNPFSFFRVFFLGNCVHAFYLH